MKHVLAILALIAATAMLLVMLATGFVLGMLWLAGILGLQHALGMDTQTSKNYASVSGVLPMMVAALGFSGVAVTMLKHLNCEVAGCWRLGYRHPGPDHKFHGRPVCGKHWHATP